MARPKLGESDTERLHLKITSDEIAAIDDWRYANRVPSRSEAVRRLVQIGLRAQRALPSVTKDTAEVLDMIAESLNIPEDVLARMNEANVDKAEFDHAVAQKLWDAVNFAFNRQIEAQDNLHKLLVELSPLAANPEFLAAVELANEQAASETPNEKILESIGASREVQLKYWRKRRQEISARRREKEQE